MEDKENKNQVVLKDIIPLEIKVGNVIEGVNSKKQDMDDEDKGDNIENATIEGNLSPKQIHALKTKQGKHNQKRMNKACTVVESSIKQGVILTNMCPKECTNL